MKPMPDNTLQNDVQKYKGDLKSGTKSSKCGFTEKARSDSEPLHRDTVFDAFRALIQLDRTIY